MSTDRHDELAAVAADDRWIDDLVAGRHDADDPLAAALASWSQEVQRPVEPAALPVRTPVADTRSRRPRGIRLVGLVASLGLIFSSGVGQAVAEDPAAPIKFVLDRGVDLGERLVGEPPSQVEGADAPRVDPGTSRNGTERPSLDDLSGGPSATGDGPRPERPSVIAPAPRSDEDYDEPSRAGVGPAQSGGAAGTQEEPPPSEGPSAAPSATPEPTTRPPSAQTTPSPSPTPTPSLLPIPSRRPIQGPKPPWFVQPTPSPTPTQPGGPGDDATSPTPDPEGTPSPSAPSSSADDGSGDGSGSGSGDSASD